jgi:hypothetical protein
MERSKQSWAFVEGQTQAVCSRNITGEEKKPKPLTRFCQICKGFSHQTINCWHQEKNRQHRPKAWTTEQAAIEEAMFISADPLPIWLGFQMQGSKDVDEEGSNEDVDEEGARRTWTREQRKGTKEKRTRACYYV